MIVGEPPPWPLVPLSAVARLVRGVSFSGTDSKDAPHPDHIPVLRAGNISDRLITNTDLQWIPRERVSDEQLLRRGDIAICMSSGSATVVGKTAPLEEDWTGCVGAFCAVIRPTGHLSPGYLSAYLRGAQFQQWRRNQAQGANIQNLRPTELEQFRIPLPPLSEQQRIVDILQEAEEIRRLRAQAEARTAELIPAMFHFAFSHSMGNTSKAKMIRLEEIADVQGGIQVTKSRDNAPLKVPYLRVANVQRDALDLAEMKEIGLTEAELERTRLLKGDILVVEEHGNPDELGRAAIWTGEIDPCTHQNHLIRVRCKPGTDPAYVLSMLNGALGRRHFLTAGNTTSGLNTISMNIVRNFRMPVPTGNAMAEFATLREATLGLTGSEVRKAKVLADKLTASLSAHAFTGKLTKDWRAARPKLLSKEARKRDDELAVAAGKPMLISFSASDPEDEAEVWQLVPGISREQWLLLFQIRAMNLKKELPRYFTAELIAGQIKGSLHRHPQAIEAHLTVFAVRGIVIPVSRARDAVPGKPFAASYRLPMNEEGAAPEQRDDVKDERMKHQRTRAAGKR